MKKYSLICIGDISEGHTGGHSDIQKDRRTQWFIKTASLLKETALAEAFIICSKHEMTGRNVVKFTASNNIH